MTHIDFDDAERKSRRDVFQLLTADYDAVRPGYPVELLEASLALGRLGTGSRILEVGCGTGQATEWYARKGLVILALDRSPAMVARARRRLATHSNVTLACRDFERDPPSEIFDGLIAATSYHWLDPSTRVEQCARRLRVEGALVLLWHTHPLPYTSFFAEVQPIYRRVVPGWTPPPSPGMSGDRIQAVRDELTLSRFFEHPARRDVRWERTYDRDSYLSLLNTYSDHALLAEEQRLTLFEQIGELIERRYSGEVVRPYQTELLVSRRTAHRIL